MTVKARDITEFLVGSTGFVGSNLTSQHKFTESFSSCNISQAFGKNPGLLVYAGVRSEMFTANNYPEKDHQHILGAIENISRISPQRLVLISTIAVYPDSHGADEDTEIDVELLTPYGQNRRELERWAEENFDDRLIVRLPALFGLNLKKNFIYDFIHVIPAMLSEAKLRELSQNAPELDGYYQLNENGLYKLRDITPEEEAKLKDIFRRAGFTAVNFTDSRAVYQFYPLKYLWSHIQTALAHGVKCLNLATPPISAGEIFRFLTGRDFVNELKRPPYSYDMRTKHYELFGGDKGYIMSREQEFHEIKEFVRECSR